MRNRKNTKKSVKNNVEQTKSVFAGNAVSGKIDK